MSKVWCVKLLYFFTKQKTFQDKASILLKSK